MSALRSADEVGRELVEHIADACNTTYVAVYLLWGAEGAGYRLSGQVGHASLASVLDPEPVLAAWLARATGPTLPSPELRSALAAPAHDAVVVAGLQWNASPLGFILLGPPRNGAAHSGGDLEFLGVVAVQATPWIAALRSSATEARAGVIEAGDRLTGAAIHDIKNSVSALSLLVRNAAGNLSDLEFQRDALATLSCTIDRMRGLLVKLTSHDAAPPPVSTEPIDLRALILEATAPLAAGRRVRLIRQLQAVAAVYGDRDALLRVIENLTTNAAEAIDDDGTVTVTLVQEDGQAVISVADTGCGMSREYLADHLFAPFSSTKTGGWGVGLYQTKQVVESQGGDILVESVVGQGTTFTVKLPLRACAETSALERVR